MGCPSLCLFLLGFEMGTILTNFHIPGMWYSVVVKSNFKHAREVFESKSA